MTLAAVSTAILLLLFMAAAASSSAAQETPRLEVFGGYSYLRFDSSTLGFLGSSDLNGWNGAVAGNFTKHFGLVGEVSAQSGSNLRFLDFLVGPQVSYRKRGATFFGHVLFGKGKTRVDLPNVGDDSGRAIAVGGGVDFAVTSHFGIRLIQADYLNSHTFQQAQSNLRFSAGIVYRWGTVGKRKHKPQSSGNP